MTAETVDTGLGEAAVLAVVLHAHARLEGEAFRQRGGGGGGENPVVHDVDEGGGFLAVAVVARGAHHHLFDGEMVFSDVQVDFEGLAPVDFHLLLGVGVADGGRHDGEGAGRDVAEHIMARIGGLRADLGAFQHDGNIGEVLSCGGIGDMARNARIGGFLRQGRQALKEECARCQGAEKEEFGFHC